MPDGTRRREVDVVVIGVDVVEPEDRVVRVVDEVVLAAFTLSIRVEVELVLVWERNVERLDPRGEV